MRTQTNAKVYTDAMRAAFYKGKNDANYSRKPRCPYADRKLAREWAEGVRQVRYEFQLDIEDEAEMAEGAQ